MMRNKLFALTSLILIMTSNSVYANWFQDIIDNAWKIGKITNGYLGNIDASQSALLENEKDMLAKQKEIERLMDDVKGALNGKSDWANLNYKDFGSYGTGSDNWDSVLKLVESSEQRGDLGKAITAISREFPIDAVTFNKSTQDQQQRQYYAAQAKTIIATRAASQLDYRRVQEQIEYQHILQKKIAEAKTLKEAADLSNRLQVESNLINLQLLREMSLANQQKALASQGEINSALDNAKFLSK